jgi:hypothetical protein
MPVIVRKRPFFKRRTSWQVAGGAVPILPFQIALSVSIAHNRERVLHPLTPRFPAVLDTGFNNTFLLREEHLQDWAGLRREHLAPAGEMTARGKKVPVFRAHVWLHPNVPGTREELPGGRPFCIELDPGLAVCPRGMTEPRLPLLGMRALFLGNLQMSFRWRTMLFSLRATPWWQRLFG